MLGRQPLPKCDTLNERDAKLCEWFSLLAKPYLKSQHA